MASEEKRIEVKTGPGLKEITDMLCEPTVSLHRGDQLIRWVDKEVTFHLKGFFHDGLEIDQVSVKITRYGKKKSGLEKVDGVLAYVHILNMNMWLDVKLASRGVFIDSGKNISPIPPFFTGEYSTNMRIGWIVLGDKEWE